MPTCTATLAPSTAYVPFLQPLPVSTHWFVLLALLVVVIATVYKAIKIEDLSVLPKQVTIMSAQILTFMILAAAALWLVSLLF